MVTNRLKRLCGGGRRNCLYAPGHQTKEQYRRSVKAVHPNRSIFSRLARSVGRVGRRRARGRRISRRYLALTAWVVCFNARGHRFAEKGTLHGTRQNDFRRRIEQDVH